MLGGGGGQAGDPWSEMFSRHFASARQIQFIATTASINSQCSSSCYDLFSLFSSSSISSMPKPQSSKGQSRPTCMFPWLHEQVSAAVEDILPSIWFNRAHRDENCNKEYSTNIMGNFQCLNDRCSKDRWTSKTVAILIRGYSNNGYNAVVFNQRCKSCNSLGKLTIDTDSYVERVAYRLKKWAGIAMETRYHNEKNGPPHERELCEGCKRGYCQKQFRSGEHRYDRF